MSNDIQFTVTITDEQVERAIARAVSVHDYAEDRTPIDIRGLVKKRIETHIDTEISKATPEIVRGIVEERVRKALDDGFPVHNSWGERTGTKSLAEIVGEMVFKKANHYDDFDLHKFIRTEAERHAKAIVSAAAKKAQAEIDKVFSEAAAEGLAALLKRVFGARVG